MPTNYYWVSWYKEQLPRAAKASQQLLTNLRGMIIILLVMPAFVAGLLVFLIGSDGQATEILLLVMVACISAIVYAVGDVFALRLLRLDRLNVGWLPLRVGLFQVLSFVNDGVVNIALYPIGVRLSYSFDSAHSTQDFETLVFLGIQVIFSRGLLFAYLQRRYRAEVLSFDMPQLLQIPPGNSVVCGMVDDILRRCRELSLPELRLSLWLLRSDRTLLPSLFAASQDEKTEYRMVIPRPFLSLVVADHPDCAFAILAHEMSHAFQNDVELWSRNDLFYSVFARTLGPQFAAIAAVSIVSAFLAVAAGRIESVGPALLVLSLTINLLRTQRTVRNARKTSEHIADVFASYLTSVESISQSIKEYATDKSRLHPSPAERIDYLTQMRTQLGYDPKPNE